MPRATPDSFRHLPEPGRREPLGYTGAFPPGEAERLRGGMIPRDMDDRWFIYFHEEWLRFHRSWTGAWIFALRLEPTPDGGVRVADSWANRDPDQYLGTDTKLERATVKYMIDHFLLAPP